MSCLRVSANVNAAAYCSIGGIPGVLFSNSCYAIFTSYDAQQPGGLSWFKALSHCQSLGSSLASIDVTSDSSMSQLADYLSSSGLDGQPLWIGLDRRPWVWVESFDPGRSTSSSIHQCCHRHRDSGSIGRGRTDTCAPPDCILDIGRQRRFHFD